MGEFATWLSSIQALGVCGLEQGESNRAELLPPVTGEGEPKPPEPHSVERLHLLHGGKRSKHESRFLRPRPSILQLQEWVGRCHRTDPRNSRQRDCELSSVGAPPVTQYRMLSQTALHWSPKSCSPELGLLQPLGKVRSQPTRVGAGQ